MNSISEIKGKTAQAYQHMQNNDLQIACDVFLDVWEDLKRLMQQKNLHTIAELQAAYPWGDFVGNWVQDIEELLNNAGLQNSAYFRKRIQYCEELLLYLDEQDQNTRENTRRAIADSHFELGHTDECDRLYQAWLNEDPSWGFGYIGWSDRYSFGMTNSRKDLMKAESIIRRALEVPDLRDRRDVVDRAVDLYTKLGDEQKASELKLEFAEEKSDYRLNNEWVTAQARTEHVGRNDPCPCGSGKKYKKCCGK